MVGCLGPPRHPSIGHVASLHLFLVRRNQLGTPNPALGVNGRLPCAPLRMHDVFEAGSLVSFHEQSFFIPPKVHSMGHLSVISGDLLRFAPCRLQNEVTSKQPGLLPPTIPVSCLKSDDCSATICVAIMTVKVKRPSQHRCDEAPDTIKAFPQLKRGGGGYFLIHSFPKLLTHRDILSNYSPNLSFGECVWTSYPDIFCRNKE